MTIPALPGVDLVPSVSSRIVTIDAVTLTEGAPVTGDDAWVEFILPVDLHVRKDGKIITASRIRVPLAGGKGSVRLPTYDPDAVTAAGDTDWGIIVRKGWGGQHRGGCNCGRTHDGTYLVRIPVGTSGISLAALPAVRPLKGREKAYAITGAGITVREGAQWDASVSLSGGVLDFDFTVPPGGTAFARGSLPSGTDLGTVKEPGLYGIDARSTYTDTPPGYVAMSNGALLVGGVGTTWATQIYMQHGTSPTFEWRTTSTSAAWNPWQTVPKDFVKHNLPTTNLDQVYESGIYILAAPFPTGYTGVPREITTAAILFVQGGGIGTWASQEIVQYGANPIRLWRISRTANGAWNNWQATGDSTKAPVSDSHLLRVQAFKDAYPLASTGGKGVVVLRFDHGLTNFKSTIWPLLQQYQVKAYIAMNSRLWTIPENSGASQADARAWIASGLIEFGNHTADHEDRSTSVGIYDNIVNGRLELEAQLDTAIHGFAVPGLTEFDAFEGFGTGSLDQFSGTYAGGVILANHGISSGGMGQPAAGGARRVLDGVVRQGGRHYTWERADWASIKQQIDAAASTKTALTLMAHPRNMGNGSYFDAALAEKVIAYVRQQIDAGNLADLSYYQSHHAQLAPLPIADLAEHLAALEYTSGLRSFTGFLIDAFTAKWFYAVRDARTVSIHIVNLIYSGSATGTITVANLPPGFRPYITATATTTCGNSALITSSGVLQIVGTPSASVDSVSFTYLTPDPAPATPPGDPA